MICSFAATIDGAGLTSPDSPHAGALYEAGCDDALLTSSPGEQRAIFGQEAPSFATAVASAITAIETAIPARPSAATPPGNGVAASTTAPSAGPATRG